MAKMVLYTVLQSGGTQEQFNIPALAVADNVEAGSLRQCAECLRNALIEYAGMFFQICIFVSIAGFHDFRLFGL